MVTKKMNTVAKPIAVISSMRGFFPRRLGCVGLKTQTFVKEILGKYTEKLNYPFDNAALIFLKQAADWREQERTQEQMVSVTCNLLSYCIRNNIYEKRYSPNSNIDGMLYRQLVPYLEQSIMVLKQTAPAQGAELERFYKEYRELTDIEHTHSEADKEEIIRQRERLAERTERFLANVTNSTYTNTQSAAYSAEQNSYTQKRFIMPVTMSQSFFGNLYHWMRENQVKNYRQLWQWQNTRQLRQYNLDFRLSQIASEADLQKQQQQLVFAIQEYGGRLFLDRLQAADDKRRETILKALQSMTQIRRQSINQEQQDISAVEGGSDVTYEDIQEKITQTLNKSDETTRKLFEERTEEYKSRFLELIKEGRADSEESLRIFSNEEIELLLRTADDGIVRQETIVRHEPIAGQEKSDETDNASVSGERAKVFSEKETELVLKSAESNSTQQETILKQEQTHDETILRQSMTERADTMQWEHSEKESSLIYETVLKKLDLIAMREIAQHFIDERSTAVQRERLEQIVELLGGVSFEPSDYDMRQETDRKNFQEVFRQYEKTQTEIRNILNAGDDVTKMLLEEKTEEYKTLFFDLIREHRIEATDSGTHNEENPEIFSDAEIELLLRTTENNSTWQETILRQEQSVQETVLRERQPELEQRAAAQSGHMENESSLVYKTALKKLDLIAIREVARHFIEEQSPIVQRERLEQITELLESVSFAPMDYDTQQETDGQKGQELFRQYEKTQTEIRNILNTSDDVTKMLLEEKTEEYKTLFYDLIREHRVEATVSGTHNEENPEIFSDAEIELLLRTTENNSTQQETILRQGQSVQETVLRERQSEPEQRETAQSGRIEKESSLVYKTATEKLDLVAMREAARHFIEEQSPIMQRERLEQITELLESVSFAPHSHETQTTPQRQAEQELFSQYDTTRTEIQNILNRSDDITKMLAAENTEEYETLFYDIIHEHRYAGVKDAAEASALARTLVYIVSNIPQANATVRTADAVQTGENGGAAAQADSALINPGSTQLPPQDISMELLTQYNSDFTRPPTGRVRNRLVLREEAGAVIPISVAGTGAGLQPQEIVYALAKNTTQKNDDEAQNRESGREIREQEIIIRRLESDLLDYQNELRNRTNQLDEVEKKLSGQQKELERFREKSYSVEGKLRTAQDSGRMMAKIKDELLLERMRSGMD